MKGVVYLLALAAVLAGCRTLLGFDDAVVGDAANIDDGEVPDADGSDAPTTTWWNPVWRVRSRITIDTTQVTGPVAGFPVLVRLGAIVPATVSATGADLRFVLDDQTTVVPYEIESFSATAGSAIWVSVPMLAPASPPFTLWLYRSNPMATPSSNAASVFGADNVSVHHLGGVGDATGHGHTATGGAGTPTAGTGVVGMASSFNGTNAYFTLAGESSYDFLTTMTVSAWVRVTTFDVDWQAIVTKGDTTWRLQRNLNTNAGSIGSTTNFNIYNLAGTSSINDAAWHQVVGVHDGLTQRLYVDGKLEGSIAFTGLLDRNDLPVSIGRNEESTIPRYWNGSIDEVRITSTARDAGWIKAEYTTVASSTFVTIGPDEAAP